VKAIDPLFARQSYEDLRRQALEFPGAGGGHGLTLFLTRGMVAWLRALGALPVPPRVAACGSNPGGAVDRSGMLREKAVLTGLLAEMVMAFGEGGGVGWMQPK
jgi:hypothetical protein